ncbi:MAG: 2-phospho-L-lactate transferase [Actinomycetes bacterium]
MRIVVLAGGIGAARFLVGLRAHLAEVDPGSEVTVVGNTADDVTLFGLRVCPDLDTVMYTLGGGIDAERGWGRTDETFHARDELAAYGIPGSWFGLGDRDLATHLVRTQMLGSGYPLSAVTEALCARWEPGVTLLPMSDDRVETHVVIGDTETPGGRRAVHFQEYWVRLHAEPHAYDVVVVGADEAKPGPGVLDAVEAADLVLIAPSNPVVSVGTILAVPGVRDALVATAAPVVGLSPIVGGAPVRGMADKVLAAVGVPASASAVARHYGPDLLNGWLVDTRDEGEVAEVERAGIACRAVPLMMSDEAATARMAADAMGLAAEVRG